MSNKHILEHDLVVKYLMGEASPEEAVLVEKFIQVSDENRSFFAEMEKTYQLTHNRVVTVTDIQSAWAKLERATVNRSVNRTIWFGLAAVFTAGILVVLNLVKSPVNSVEFNTQEQIVSEVLSDKSEILIFKNSTLKLAKGYGDLNRTITLKGKAGFKVSHIGLHPFIVQADGVMIEDIGTAFTVENYPFSDTVYVIVNEGVVRMYDKKGQELLIKAGEKAWYIKSQKRIIADTATKVVKFDFRQTKLSDVVRFLEDAYDVSIELNPTQLGECTITTQFFDEDLPTIINVITETSGLRYEYYNNSYKIGGEPCQ